MYVSCRSCSPMAAKRPRQGMSSRRQGMSSPQRMYGYFRCPVCKRGWESSWAWCKRGTDVPTSGQQCQNPGCPDDYIKPHQVERLRCSQCDSNTGCDCDKHHVDPSKPHRTDLCERCRKGLTCNYR